MPQIVISNQFNPYLNIAVENHLFTQRLDGGVVLYLWRNRRTVVIGQNQNPYAECDLARLEADGGHLMRRRTGGGAVYHDMGNLNFTFVAPNESYDIARQMHVVQDAVEHYGLRTEVSGRNDILVEGRKFSGNAFGRGADNRLHHGTIMIRTDVEELQRYLKPKPAKLQKHGVASVQSRIVNLSELVPTITAEGLTPLLVEAFEREYGTAQRLDFDQLAALPAVKALRDEFASAEWKYGRWREFRVGRSAQFEWGEVALSAEVDQAAGVIRSVQIASDSLFPDAIAEAQRRLTGASTSEPPKVGDCENSQILTDIIQMLYEKN